jgi:hypothetical protein
MCVWRGGGGEMEREIERWGVWDKRREECYVSESFYHPAVTCVARILLYVGTASSHVLFI